MSRDDEELAILVDELHEEAMQLIRSGHSRWYADINETYREILLAFPRESKKYGSAEWADQRDIFRRGPIEQIEHALYEEAREALRFGSREVAFEAVASPRRIAEGALEMGADGLMKRMLALGHQYYEAAKKQGGDIPDLAASHVALLTIEFVDYRFSSPLTLDPVEDVGQITRLVNHLRTGFREVAELVRRTIDFGDYSQFLELETRWADMLDLWEPGPTIIDHIDLTHARANKAPDQPLDNLERTYKFKVSLERLKDELVRLRLQYWVGLLHWVLTGPDFGEETAQKVVAQLLSHFSTVGDLVTGFTEALEAEWSSDSTLLNQWFWERRQPRYGSGVYDPTLGLLRTFVIVSVWNLATVGEQQIPSVSWIRSRFDELVATANSLSLADIEFAAISTTDLVEGVRRFVKAVTLAAQEQEKLQKAALRGAHLSLDRVDLFQSHVLQAWEDSRLVPYLYRAVGSTPSISVKPQESVERIEYLSKDYFVEPVAVAGMESVAARLGTQLASTETKGLLDNASAAPMPNLSTLKQRVATLLDQVDRESVVLLMPRRIDMIQELGLPLAGSEPPTEWGMESGRRHGFVGQFDGIYCFQAYAIAETDVITLRVDGIHWTYDLDPRTNGPPIELSELDDNLAREIIAASKGVQPDEVNDEDVLQALERVRVQVFRWWRVASEPGSVMRWTSQDHGPQID